MQTPRGQRWIRNEARKAGRVRARGARAALLILGAAVVYPHDGTRAEVTIGQGAHEGADFIIGMPARARWNGDLVMFAHG
jgi:hypothetical protein